MSSEKSFKIGDVVFCRCADGVELPVGLPDNARAKVVATYIGSAFVEYDGRTYMVPNACVHSDSDEPK